jgi:hypothetical protein
MFQLKFFMVSWLTIAGSFARSSSLYQTCADLAEQHSPTGSSADLDGGCALFSAIRNCPVSCRDFNRPLCFDGTLPAPLPGQSPFGNVTKCALPSRISRELISPELLSTYSLT